MRITRDYGQNCGGMNCANTYFTRDPETQIYVDKLFNLLRNRPMSVYELSTELGIPVKRLYHIIDTATLLYGNVWEETRWIKLNGKRKEVTYYAAE